ncbi:FAD-dependent oxidoreductase [Mucilaginibacter sabulilitoris]|uniref:FAD-dependent oxidoreductase n=1 Tax=Mucilaginibacter sabulilitoris TaxID=1173583 RepID=A0ABZ0TK36_9SPHI|nr:FAD-dependent oxidoreductase [Mucilaginibacter sabulilitoris]WPU93189.1 FAD-dependent oxidoreductase [Mucilaginibacter sabulilitoris]
MKIIIRSLLILIIALFINKTSVGLPQKNKNNTYDVVIYGGTASGVMAAIASAKEGAKVVILEPKLHIGGMVTGGLAATDIGRRSVIGGYPLEFFKRLGKYYNYQSMTRDSIGWFPEPHVAELVLNQMIKEAGITVYYQKRLKEKGGVKIEGGKITGLIMENGDEFTGKVFIDATYEGDLMAFAGVSYIVGREAKEVYNEYSAGIRDSFGSQSAYDDAGKLLPRVQTQAPGPVGSGDTKTQAYNFRLSLTNDPGNLVPFPKPGHYDTRRYIDLLRTTLTLINKEGAVQAAEHMFPGMGKVPHDKVDLNAADYVGGNWDYPDGSYQRRKQIWEDHVDYVAGYMYFLGHDEHLPQAYRDAINRWGLSKDEFIDNHNWPYELYVREARRMVGVYVITQHDVVSDMQKTDAIGLGSYGLDVHPVQAWVNDKGLLKYEGRPQRTEQERMKHIPYQIPYRAIIPRKSEVKNLLVPVCLSASHVAYSTLRMEPQFMILGQAAGTAAYLAVKQQKTVQDIDIKELAALLRTRGAFLESKIKTLGDLKPGMGID